MLITPAQAAHFTPPSGSSGGAIALSIILAVGVGALLISMGLKKWRGHKQRRDGGDE